MLREREDMEHSTKIETRIDRLTAGKNEATSVNNVATNNHHNVNYQVQIGPRKMSQIETQFQIGTEMPLGRSQIETRS